MMRSSEKKPAQCYEGSTKKQVQSDIFDEKYSMNKTTEHMPISKESKTINTPKRICAWCNKVMQEGTKPVTHGMCSDCLQMQIESLWFQGNVTG